jgi:serpin B
MPFYRWRNKEHKFHRLDGSTVDSKFMHSNEDQLVATHDGFKVLKMAFTVNDPYYGVPTWEMGALMRNKSRTLLLPTRYSMCIFLPDAPGGLWSLEKKMASSPGFLHEHLPKKRVRVGEFRVPKFNLSFYTSVKRSLQDLGIESAFSTGADLRDMLEDHGPARQPLFLADILHEVDIEVDEDGTQPAAYTACAMCGACLWPEGRPGCVDFIADHPFAFFVIEEVSGVVLLAGHVLDPTKW